MGTAPGALVGSSYCFRIETDAGTDALNKYRDNDDPRHTLCMLKYIFPRQFRLHNVFTSDVDFRDTAASSKNYVAREDETDRADLASRDSPNNLPKRLRGQAFEIIRKLQKRHSNCAYSELLQHYCPKPEISESLADSLPHFKSLASNDAQVFAFCKAVLLNVLPPELLGEQAEDNPNRRILIERVKSFLKLRRFENFTLQEVMMDMKPSMIGWLAPPGCIQEQRTSRTDYEKRVELLAELVYWIFDAFLIPFIRANFYVTESATHRNRLFFFRHDVWREMVLPAKAELKSRMLTKIDGDKAADMLNSRSLAYSQLRFMPKDRGMRPIANLRRRMPIVRNGMKLLGKSVNSTLTPAFNILNYEKV